MDIGAQSLLPTGGHKVLSREEWLKLKPIILQLYIDENQTYSTVASELARRFDFYPTKRQFTRKIEEWGLKKNFRKAERKLLLQNNMSSGTAQFIIGDKRVSDTKRIQRLKKRYAHENPCSQVQGVPSYQNIYVPPKSDGSYCSLEEQLLTSDHVDAIASAHVASTALDVTEEDGALDLEQLPLGGDNDFHGSFGLTRLLQRLEIEASMPPLNLDDEVVNTKQTISGNELRNNVESYGTTSRQLSTFSSGVKYAYIPNVVVQPVSISGKRIPWSPLFELDLFPTSQSTRGNGCEMSIASLTRPLIDVWDKDIKEWKLKLQKFRKTLPDHNPAIILNLEHLIHLFEQQGMDSLHLWHQLLAARLRESCPNNHKIMEVYLEIVMLLLLKGKFPDATYLSRSLRKAIQKAQLSSEHPFHIRLSYLEAYILYIDRQFAEAESIIRPVIQNLLNNQNLDRSHKMTSDALILLAFLIQKKDGYSYSEIEKLHGYNIHQVSKHGPSLGGIYFENMGQLVYILLEGQKIEEAHSLCVYMMECVESTLGKRHYWYSNYQEQLGLILLKKGLISESIDVFRNILLEEDDGHLRSMAYQNIGQALSECGNLREAIVMYKSCLLMEVQEKDWGDLRSLEVICRNLGIFYEELMQFQDALFLYENFLGKIKDTAGDKCPLIKEVEDWISKVQEQMEESSVSDEDDGSENTDPSREVQMGEVNDELGYGQFVEGIVDDVSLREIFEIEDRGLDEKIADISKQISSIKLS
ncbi:uncharacterized protein EAE97_006447 [Botrytis byssoidea]|uniref:Clr5 domain-containing protein n=1 Tax=Botrytis byssoidea TaxID=139641 RepID=A0A9P5M289_9HELO|nr:uncharacterized protein EAE97_006447 [Botrytis byssoidea]KAF7941610.1 hypothetical protein EAE97_006447 [Botrytis byssoidea]